MKNSKNISINVIIIYYLLQTHGPYQKHNRKTYEHKNG